MPIIAAMTPKRRGAGITVVFDAAPAVELSEETVARYGLRAGLALPDERIASIAAEDERARATEAAWALLAYRARTRSELRQRLLRKGYGVEAVDAVLERLTALGYLDDAAFARALVSARQRGPSARGSFALRAELRRRGVQGAIAEDSVALADDSAAVQTAAAKRARALSGLPYPDFRRRLFAFLQRRGFDRELAQSAVVAAWTSLHGGVDDEDDA